MKIYLAAGFRDKDVIRERCEELRALGLEVSCRWPEEPAPANTHMKDCTHAYLLATAMVDDVDIRHADMLVLFTTNEALPRGGRHFECGYAYGLGKQVVTVGPRENIFHYYPDIPNFPTWEKAKVYILEQEYLRRRNQVRSWQTASGFDPCQTTVAVGRRLYQGSTQV